MPPHVFSGYGRSRRRYYIYINRDVAFFLPVHWWSKHVQKLAPYQLMKLGAIRLNTSQLRLKAKTLTAVTPTGTLTLTLDKPDTLKAVWKEINHG